MNATNSLCWISKWANAVKLVYVLRSIYNISYYIDYSKRRLNNVKHLFTNPIHISMLLN